MAFIEFDATHRFGDPLSQMKFDEFYKNFKLRHTSDSHQTFYFDYTIAGKGMKKAYMIGQLTCDYIYWYYIFGVVALLWPYSMWV